MPKRRPSLGQKVPSLYPVPLEERVTGLAKALSDPNDLRTDEELASDLEIPYDKIRDLKTSPGFMEPVLQSFRRNLASIAPDLIKQLFRQAKTGSVASSRLLMETSGIIKTGTSITFNMSGAQSTQSQDLISQMTDVDLDREAHRLLMETFPDDVVLSEGKVIPANFEVIDANMEELAGVGSSPIGRSNGKGKKGKVVQTSVGETEEDVGS